MPRSSRNQGFTTRGMSRAPAFRIRVRPVTRDGDGPVWIPDGEEVPPGFVPSLGPDGQPHDQK